MPKPPLPPGIELPEVPGPLPAATPRADRNPASPQTLPEFARAWTAPPPAKVAVTRDPSRMSAAPGQAAPSVVHQQIQETHRGVEALQVLIEPPPAPSRTDTMLELLESIDNRAFRMEERQKGLELMMLAVLKHLRLPVPKP